MKKRIISATIAVLLLTLTFTTTIMASAIEPRASEQLSSYFATMYADGSSDVSVEFYVSATQTADEVGATQIVIQKKVGSTWTTAQTFTSSSTSGLIGTNCLFHTAEVTHDGIVGQQYRAVITFYAKIGTGSTSRSYTTNIVTAS